jgi:hypothetical protein
MRDARALVQEEAAAFERRDWAALTACFVTDCRVIDAGSGRTYAGHGELADYCRRLAGALRDIRVEVTAVSELAVGFVAEMVLSGVEPGGRLHRSRYVVVDEIVDDLIRIETIYPLEHDAP